MLPAGSPPSRFRFLVFIILGGLPMSRWNRKTVREYAPYTRWDLRDPMHHALDAIPASDCELFKRAYWDREPRDLMARECGVGTCRMRAMLGDICDSIAEMMNGY